MYQKKDMIYSETLGVCRVDDITKLVNAQGQGGMYYVLKAKYEKNKISYIPVEQHKVILRDLMSEEEATQIVTQEDYNRDDFLLCGELAYVLGKEIEEIQGTIEA